MKRNGIILMAVVAVLAFAGQAFATVAVTAASPQASGGSIDGSSPFQIDIYMDYTGTSELMGFGFSFSLTSPDGSIEDVTHVDVGGDTELPSIQYLGSFLTYFNLGVLHEDGATLFDGTLPDYVNIGPLGLTGMPSGLGSVAYIRFNLDVDYSTTGTTGQLCIDSIASAESGGDGDWDWLFDNPVTFNAASGAICWTITNLTPSDVHEIRSDDAILPTEFNLGQNYPNPFNPSTTFEFALPELSKVNIGIYNVLGQLVKTLADAEYAAGRYSVDWDGTSDNGSPVATGIYFYRMNANDFQATKKLMLLK